MTTFSWTDKFDKEFCKIKVKNLNGDLQRWQKGFETRGTDLAGVVGPIPGLQKKGVKIPTYKVKKFRCKELNKGSDSGIRIVFAYDKEQDKVCYIEIYTKNNRKNHDEKLIINTLKGVTNL